MSQNLRPETSSEVALRRTMAGVAGVSAGCMTGGVMTMIYSPLVTAAAIIASFWMLRMPNIIVPGRTPIDGVTMKAFQVSSLLVMLNTLMDLNQPAGATQAAPRTEITQTMSHTNPVARTLRP